MCYILTYIMHLIIKNINLLKKTTHMANNITTSEALINDINEHYREVLKTIGCLVGCWYGFNVSPVCYPCDPVIFGCLGSIVGNSVYNLSKPLPTILVDQPLSSRNIFNSNYTLESEADTSTIKQDPTSSHMSEENTSTITNRVQSQKKSV